MYPFRRRLYELQRGPYAGKRIHFVDHGPADAPAALLLHGNPAWGFLWRKVIPLLDGFRVVVPDMLGLGLSDRLRKDEFRLTDLGGAVAELAEVLDLREATVAGQDWGGPLLTTLGAKAPERVRAVVLGNTAVIIPDRPRGTGFHRFARLPLLSDLVFRGFGFPQNSMHHAQGDPASIRGEVAAAYRWPLRRFADRVAPLALARMVPDRPEHPSMLPLKRGEAWLRAFKGPIALVWGERDPILAPALRRHVAALPDAEVTRCQAGHFLQEEVPELLAAAIRRVATSAGIVVPGS